MRCRLRKCYRREGTPSTPIRAISNRSASNGRALPDPWTTTSGLGPDQMVVSPAGSGKFVTHAKASGRTALAGQHYPVDDTNDRGLRDRDAPLIGCTCRRFGGRCGV